jgi:hypothetical protein
LGAMANERLIIEQEINAKQIVRIFNILFLL